MANTNPRRDEIAKKTNDATRARIAARHKVLGDRSVGKDPDHPVPGSQRWAEKQGLAEKKEDPK